MTATSNLVIANPDRIIRILEKIKTAGLNLLIRVEEHKSIGIKGKIKSIELSENNRHIYITDISHKGLKLLQDTSKVNVDFILMSNKVIFTAKKIFQDREGICLSIPNQLVSIERRQNARYNLGSDHSGYLVIGKQGNTQSDKIGIPHYSFFPNFENTFLLGDLSVGGFSISSHFPDANTVFFQGFIENAAKLYFPMREPINVGFEIRWVKKLSEHIYDQQNPGRMSVVWKFGGMFIPRYYNEDAKLSIKQFIHILNQANAI